MTRCGACGTENPAAFRFCGGCGSALGGGGCPSCGFDNPPGLRFCGRCGAAQPDAVAVAAAAAPAITVVEERKLATVVFADVVGFTALAETTDPETLSRRVDTAFRDLAAIVTDHGGSVDKYMGDSLMAVFGVPVSHGDDAERAVAAALVMASRDSDLRFSIGVNSGEVMVTAVAGGGVTVMGDTVNVAARLEKVASAGEVLVGPLTAELVGPRVQLCERSPVLLKGKREPVPVFEAISLRDGAAAPAVDADAPPLVDREDELAFLRSTWRRAVAGRRPAVLLLTGDPGVGKTRLIDELVAALGDDVLVARSACLAYGSSARARVMSDWARGLGLGKHRPADGCEEAAVAPRSEEEGMIALRRMLSTRAAEHPLLLVLDDCHHAEAEHLEPLARLIPRLGGLPLLLLLAGRSDPSGWLAPFSGATTLHLDCLAVDDAVTLATALAGDLRLTRSAAAGLATRSQGNPLHLRELVRLLRARGALAAESAVPGDAARPGLPPSSPR